MIWTRAKIFSNLHFFIEYVQYYRSERNEDDSLKIKFSHSQIAIIFCISEN